MLSLHLCYTADGEAINCACMTHKDHDENNFDNPDAPEHVDGA